MASDEKMPVYFQNTFDMVTTAYPNGVPASDRPALIVVLHEEMSMRRSRTS